MLELSKRRVAWSKEWMEKKVFINMRVEWLKIVRVKKEDSGEKVLVLRSHGNIRISEWTGSALLQVDR